MPHLKISIYAHEFPLMKADVSETFGFPKYPDVKGEILTWPLSVVRLTSPNKKDLLAIGVRKFPTSFRPNIVDGTEIVATKEGARHGFKNLVVIIISQV